MNKRKQYYGVKFPFTKENSDEVYLDVNEDLIEKAKSDMLHLIFTPKGQRYRMPEFGTRLIDFIFDNNDEKAWADIKDEIRTAVEKYVPTVSIKDIESFTDEKDDHVYYVRIKYTVTDGVKTTEVLETSVKI